MNWANAFFAGDAHHDHHRPLDGLRGLAVLMVVFGRGANHGLGPVGPDSMMIRGKLGVYLFHIPVLMWVRTWAIPSGPLWFIYLGGTVLVCAATFLLVERPLQLFKPFTYGSKTP